MAGGAPMEAIVGYERGLRAVGPGREAGNVQVHQLGTLVGDDVRDRRVVVVDDGVDDVGGRQGDAGPVEVRREVIEWGHVRHEDSRGAAASELADEAAQLAGVGRRRDLRDEVVDVQPTVTTVGCSSRARASCSSIAADMVEPDTPRSVNTVPIGIDVR